MNSVHSGLHNVDGSLPFLIAGVKHLMGNTLKEKRMLFTQRLRN